MTTARPSRLVGVEEGGGGNLYTYKGARSEMTERETLFPSPQSFPKDHAGSPDNSATSPPTTTCLGAVFDHPSSPYDKHRAFPCEENTENDGGSFRISTIG